MNVLIEIQGRRAIPVRAIPLLFDRSGSNSLSADEVAEALAGDDSMPNFEGFKAYCLEDGKVLEIKSVFWGNNAVRDLEALSDKLTATDKSHEEQHQRWRTKSIAALPAKAFVWADDYERCIQSAHRNRNITAEYIGDEVPTEPTSLDFDYSPFIANDENERLVMEGFQGNAIAVAPTAQTTATPAPVETVEQRRTRYLALLEDEEKHGKRGALTRVAVHEGVDRSNMSKDIKKARTARTSNTRAGTMFGPLVQVRDGKRQN